MQQVTQRRVRRRTRWASIGLLALAVGCDPGTASSIFNPAFVNVVAGDSTEQASSIQNAPGHVPMIFVNKLRYDSQTIGYLEALRTERRLANLDDFGTDLGNLKPRVRMRILVTFDNGTTLPFEFVSGDSVLEIERSDEDQNDPPIPDPTVEPVDPVLTQNDLERLVAICDVARIDVDGDPQVFVPVFTRVIQVVTDIFGFRSRVLVRTDRPQFRPALADEVDQNLNITLRRNFSVREAPAPAQNLACGSMVGIVIEGTVSVPFTQPEDDSEDTFIAQRSSVPGFVDTDVSAEASIPGRFKFTVQVR